MPGVVVEVMEGVHGGGLVVVVGVCVGDGVGESKPRHGGGCV